MPHGSVEKRYRRAQFCVAAFVVVVMVVPLTVADGWLGGLCGLLVALVAVKLGLWIDRRAGVREAMTRE